MKPRHFLFISLTLYALGLGKTLCASEKQPWFDTALPHAQRIDALVEAMTLEEKTSQLLNDSPAIPRLGVTEYNWWNEALHGVARNGKATVFPQPIALAATFDDELLHTIASAISDEARAKYVIAQNMGNRSHYAGLTFWTPNINIFRDPRWGRGMETYGEDPYLTTQLGIAMATGLQGDHPHYLKSAATAKHFAVHSGPEKLRHEFDAITNKKDLYETYLPAFEALVKQAKVETVMGAYNRVNGEAANGSRFLLQDLLRDQWGFEGHVVSDCWALVDFHKFHNITKNEVESAALAINSGVDLNCGVVYLALNDAVKQGLVTEETIDKRLKTLLKTRFKLGMFDPLEANPYNRIPSSVINSDEHAELAYQAASKSIVLLQNRNSVLPLSPNIRNLYVTGPMSASTQALLGNYYGLSGRYTNILEGITNAVSLGTTINYKQGILPYQAKVNPIDWVTEEAQRSDAIIVVLGIDTAWEGEEGDAVASPDFGDRLSLSLPKHQIEFLAKLKENNTKPVIAVITAGSPVIMQDIQKYADAVLFAWYPGQEGGRAVGDILFGKQAPSGRLPISFPISEDQLPPYEDYNMANRTYRYMTEAPAYPFGFGLSYSSTTFNKPKIMNKKAIRKGENPRVQVQINNAGTRDIEEVIQVYLSNPKAGKGQPLSSLVAFKRIWIGAGESKTIDLEVDSKSLYAINENGEKVLLKGKYQLHVGNASPGNTSKQLGAQITTVNFSM